MIVARCTKCSHELAEDHPNDNDIDLLRKSCATKIRCMSMRVKKMRERHIRKKKKKMPVLEVDSTYVLRFN